MELEEEEEPKNPVVNPNEVTYKPAQKTAHCNQRQAEMIADIIKKGKRHFGSAAASLTHLQDPDRKGELPEGWKPEVLDVAIKGEKSTSEFIEKWMADKPAAVLVDSLHIPGAGREEVNEDTGLLEGGDTDHILIIGDYLIVIDSKAWKKKSRYTVQDSHTVLRNGKEFPGGNVKIDDALHMWFDYIDDDDLEIFGAIFIDNDDEQDPKTKEWSTSVFRNRNWWQNYWFLVEQSRMKSWLDERYREIAGYDEDSGEYEDLDSIKVINPNLIAQVASTCQRPYSWSDAKGIDMKSLIG